MGNVASKLRVAVVGLGFGASFVPIYKQHPNVEAVVICDANPELLQSVGDKFGIAERLHSLEEVLANATIDAVHLLTPVPFHVEHTVAVLNSGKHCACAVPMATSLEGIQQVIEAQRSTEKNYMMMETGAYSREILYVLENHRAGFFGELTFFRGTYFQDLEGDYPGYWRAQPPMHYVTHIVGPILAIAKTRATRVCCFGSGILREDIQQPGGNRFPLQTAILQLEGTPAAAEITHSWFQVARSFTEAFCVYGDRRGFEWSQLGHEDPALFTLDEERPVHKRDASYRRIQVPFRPDLLPHELAEFADGGHGGSHPHLTHEFVSSCVEGRPSAIDVFTSADWTAPGICANESSLRNGEPVTIPSFR